MALDDQVVEWVIAMRKAGASDATILLILQERGWTESDAVRSVEASYSRDIGIEPPKPTRVAKVRPRDAFLYLILYSSLIAWTTALIAILFFAIESLFPEATVNTYGSYEYKADSIIEAIATLVVLLPIYLWASAVLKKEQRENPERLTSPIRFWITYLALFIGLSVILIYLTTVIADLLRGELTIGIVFRTFVVLVVVGGLMWMHGSALRAKGG
jgi:hypothetical protein